MLHPASNHRIPSIYLQRVTEVPSAIEVKFAVKIINRQDRSKSIDYGKFGNLQVLQVNDAYMTGKSEA